MVVTSSSSAPVTRVLPGERGERVIRTVDDNMDDPTRRNLMGQPRITLWCTAAAVMWHAYRHVRVPGSAAHPGMSQAAARSLVTFRSSR